MAESREGGNFILCLPGKKRTGSGGGYLQRRNDDGRHAGDYSLSRGCVVTVNVRKWESGPGTPNVREYRTRRTRPFLPTRHPGALSDAREYPRAATYCSRFLRDGYTPLASSILRSVRPSVRPSAGPSPKHARACRRLSASKPSDARSRGRNIICPEYCFEKEKKRSCAIYGYRTESVGKQVNKKTHVT